jgi:arginine N-succinyltransferase
MRIRPVRTEDHAAILALAKEAGFGMTSLPADEDVLEEKIAGAVNSFNGTPDYEDGERFLFVLEDVQNKKIVGTCGIVAHVGLRQPFYSYKLSTITQNCKELDIFGKQKVLNVVNDYTGASEIGSLFLLPEYRRDRIGRFLSRVRFVFMAQFPDLFDERVIAEIRGVHDRSGNSPFYDSIAKHFFHMPFADADYINATSGNEFITDLMPRYPIYVNLLPETAQEVIGAPLPSSEAAKAMLQREGFRYNDYLDVFDGGPTIEARFEDIVSIKESKLLPIGEIVPFVEGEKHIIGTTRFKDFSAAVGRLNILDDGSLRITERIAKILNLTEGDVVRVVIA